MAANGSGLQGATIKNLALAWVMTLPAAIVLSGTLYAFFFRISSETTEAIMRAIDVMVREVVTVHPDTDVADAVKLLGEHDVSALPVIGADGKLVGMLSEADLIHRVEIGTETHRPWWLKSLTGAARSPPNSPSRTARRSVKS